MRGRMLIVRPEGARPSIEVRELSGPPPLADLQSLVGGYLEAVPHFCQLLTPEGRTVATAFCDEEGKLKGLPFNLLATAMWQASASGPTGDVLVGTVVIVTGDQELMTSL